MTLIILIIIVGQMLVGTQAYTLTDDFGQFFLSTDSGRMSIELGNGCDDIQPWQNVEWLPGSGDVGAIRLPGSDHVCNIGVDALLDTNGCYANPDGLCDVNYDPGNNL